MILLVLIHLAHQEVLTLNSRLLFSLSTVSLKKLTEYITLGISPHFVVLTTDAVVLVILIFLKHSDTIARAQSISLGIGRTGLFCFVFDMVLAHEGNVKSRRLE